MDEMEQEFQELITPVIQSKDRSKSLSTLVFFSILANEQYPLDGYTSEERHQAASLLRGLEDYMGHKSQSVRDAIVYLEGNAVD